ncbi:hypothetical protein [Kangiella sp.]|uniref:hypothetical protein n=1 Tax=Kangiella sp. TaxID=1920245 RepID=UPI003A920A63
MSNQDRKTALCAQSIPAQLTGIDFVQIKDKDVQNTLQVFFIVEPDDLASPLVDGGSLPVALTAVELSAISIDSQSSGQQIEVSSATWIEENSCTTDSGAEKRIALEINVSEPGGFELHRLTLNFEQLDRFFKSTIFSFKQACPSDLDCATESECPEQPRKNVNIDYLARDFWSFRSALIDFASQYYPEWEEKIEADQAMMILEVMAAIGDEFAYTQDRYALEAYLSTATQTQNIINHARLVDYQVNRGKSAETTLIIGATGTPQYTRIRDDNSSIEPDTVYALKESVGKIPFQVIEKTWVHPRWNQAEIHMPDPGEPCLELGATEAYLKLSPPTAGELPPDVAFSSAADFWVGRRIILRSGIGVSDEPNRSWLVVVTDVEAYEDPLILDPGTGLPTVLTRVAWSKEQALPFQMPFSSAYAYLNCVDVIAGETIKEYFRIGSVETITQKYNSSLNDFELAQLVDLEPAVERLGACVESRGLILRYGLAGSIDKGLAWSLKDKSNISEPVISIIEVEPDATDPERLKYKPFAGSLNWQFIESILNANSESSIFTVEHGYWGEVTRYQKPSGDVVHYDYAGNDGFSIRFGDGAFGRLPNEGAILQVTYLTAPGTKANLSSDAITLLASPSDGIISMDYAEWVTNPFSINSAEKAESIESIKQNAPEAYQHLPLRAVKLDDYQEILERDKRIQKAKASSRWTGSWATDFVAVDPMDTTSLSDEIKHDVDETLDCIRQAGRSVCHMPAVYLPVDIKVEVCAKSDFQNSKVIRSIQSALTNRNDPNSFFHPNNFSFGEPLIRSQLEASIQTVDGVKGIENIKIRKKGESDFKDFKESLYVAANEIIQVNNNPEHPEAGHVSINAHGGG